MTAPPLNITARVPDRKLILSWSPVHVAELPFKYLRCHCGCARCVDERTGQRTLDPATVAESISLQDLTLVGNYALKVVWSDGHDTGLYSWDYLLRICPCAACGGPKPFDRRPSPLGSADRP
jgi:DUF971 family protein